MKLDEMSELQLSLDLIEVYFNNVGINKLSKRRLRKLIDEIKATDINEVERISKLQWDVEKLIEEKERCNDKTRYGVVIEGLKHTKTGRTFSTASLKKILDETISWMPYGRNLYFAVRDYNTQRYLMANKGKTEISTSPFESIVREQVSEPVKSTPKKTSSAPTFRDQQNVLDVLAAQLNDYYKNSLVHKFNGTGNLENELRAYIGEQYYDIVNEIVMGAARINLTANCFKHYNKNKSNPFKYEGEEPALIQVLQSASDVVKILPMYLTLPHESKFLEFAHKLTDMVDMNHCIENYAKVYGEFIRYFENLPDDKKAEIVDEHDLHIINRFPSLELDEEFGIPTPDKIAALVNSSVREKMLTDEYRDNCALEQSPITILEIMNATKYMNSEEVASIYIQMKNNYLANFKTYGDGTDDERIRARDEYLENLQHNFARAVMAKEVDHQLSPEQESEKLNSICNGLFQEDACASLVNVSSIQNREQIMLTNIDKEKEENLFIYGIEKLQEVFGRAKKVYGSYARHEELSVMVEERGPVVDEKGISYRKVS